MFEGRDPTTGELLGRPHGRNAVPAFDVVLRPTKSVSILYGLGDAAIGRAVLSAHHAGLAEAVGYLDEHLGARRGHGGVQHVSGQGVLAVGFDHRTSREGDPLLHTHLVVANRVQGPDGRWTALDGRDLYRHRRAADAIYRTTYQRELSRTIGVEWTAADATATASCRGCPRTWCAGSPSAPARSTPSSTGSGRTVGSGHRGWSSGPSRPPASPSNTRPRRPCMDAGVRRRPSVAWTRTPLAREVTGRTPNRDQDRPASAEVVGRLFDGWPVRRG
jgi:TrwC relaxase